MIILRILASERVHRGCIIIVSPAPKWEVMQRCMPPATIDSLAWPSAPKTKVPTFCRRLLLYFCLWGAISEWCPQPFTQLGWGINMSFKSSINICHSVAVNPKVRYLLKLKIKPGPLVFHWRVEEEASDQSNGYENSSSDSEMVPPINPSFSTSTVSTSPSQLPRVFPKVYTHLYRGRTVILTHGSVIQKIIFDGLVLPS